MGRMEALDGLPLPFEGTWALPTRLAAVLAFLRALLRAVHADEVSELHVDGVYNGLGVLVVPWDPDVEAGGAGIAIVVPARLRTSFHLEDVDELAVG